jgi:transcription initiation factor TFIIB
MSYDLENLFNILKDKRQENIEENLKEGHIITDNDKCDSCDSKKLVTDNGRVICKDCGVINYCTIDGSAEWRFYGSEDSKFSDPTRCGLPTNNLLPESSLGSTISFRYGETYEMRKIRNYHLWNAMPYRERSLYNVFDGIQVRANDSGIPSCIIDEAKNLYKRISDIQINRGSNRSGIIASCIYKACKLQGCPRSAKEIAEIFKLKITHMTKGCKKFDEILNLDAEKIRYTSSTTKSVDFIERFCSKLNLGTNIINICKHVCEKAEEYNLVSKCIPPSIAAGSIFLVCQILNVNISKKDISQTCKISEVTISKCYKSLLKYHKYLFPENIINKLYK